MQPSQHKNYFLKKKAKQKIVSTGPTLKYFVLIVVIKCGNQSIDGNSDVSLTVQGPCLMQLM